MDWAALVSFPICFAAFLALALAMHRSSREALGTPTGPVVARRLRVGAIAGFAIAFLVVAGAGGVALVGGLMATFLAGAASISVLTWRPGAALALLRISAVLGAAAVVLMVTLTARG